MGTIMPPPDAMVLSVGILVTTVSSMATSLPEIENRKGVPITLAKTMKSTYIRSEAAISFWSSCICLLSSAVRSSMSAICPPDARPCFMSETALRMDLELKRSPR